MTTVREFSITSGCSTAGLRPLNDQIVALVLAAVNTEVKKTLVPCDDIPRLRVVGNSTIALLQPAAREALELAIRERGRDLALVHAYRTIAQQFVLRQWKIRGRCGITSARNPGKSDHEKGSAIDIEDFGRWEAVLERHGWKSAAPGDEGHFSFKGDSNHPITPLVLKESVRAFQHLWNQHNPGDRIDEDGVYGVQQTGARLLLSPIEGF